MSTWKPRPHTPDAPPDRIDALIADAEARAGERAANPGTTEMTALATIVRRVLTRRLAPLPPTQR